MVAVPVKVPTNHPVEPLVVGLEETPQSSHVDLRETGMGSALGLSQTMGVPASFALLETGKSLGAVEVEVVPGHQPVESEKVLHERHLLGGVANELLPANDVDTSRGKVVQPTRKVVRVESNPDGGPTRVHLVPETNG